MLGPRFAVGLRRWGAGLGGGPVTTMLATVTATELLPLLDEAQAGLLSAAPERIHEVLDLLTGELAERRAMQAAPEWRATIAECRRHPLAQLLLDDPLSRRALTRPRGIAGDAELLDMIYRRSWHGLAPEPTRVGAAVFEHTSGGRTAAALRARREFIAQQIAQTCERGRYPHVLAVGCGHLRELGLCEPFLAGQVGRFVGLDDDEAALREVQRSLPSLLVQTVAGSTAFLLSGGLREQQFDLIYSAGLYDYRPGRDDGAAHAPAVPAAAARRAAAHRQLRARRGGHRLRGGVHGLATASPRGARVGGARLRRRRGPRAAAAYLPGFIGRGSLPRIGARGMNPTRGDAREKVCPKRRAHPIRPFPVSAIHPVSPHPFHALHRS